MMQERAGMLDDPLMFAINLTHAHNKVMSNYILALERANDILGEDVDARRTRLLADTGTRAATYRGFNPTFSVQSVYSKESRIGDDLRIEFTRLRTSSHRLRIETGRWGARVPREARTCQCDMVGAVQDERHVLVECPLSEGIRIKYGATNIDFTQFMSSEKSTEDLKMLREVMDLYE